MLHLQTHSTEIMPALKRNIFNVGYGINFKYKRRLAHSFDRFYVLIKFILPSVNDLKFSPIDFNSQCSYLNADLSRHQNTTQYLSNLKTFVRKLYHSLIL